MQGIEENNVVLNETGYHQIVDSVGIQIDKRHVGFTRITDDEIDEIRFGPEVAQYEDVGLRRDEPLHEPANGCLQWIVRRKLKRKHSLQEVRHAQSDCRRQPAHVHETGSQRMSQIDKPAVQSGPIDWQRIVDCQYIDERRINAAIHCRSPRAAEDRVWQRREQS